MPMHSANIKHGKENFGIKKFLPFKYSLGGFALTCQVKSPLLKSPVFPSGDGYKEYFTTQFVGLLWLSANVRDLKMSVMSSNLNI